MVAWVFRITTLLSAFALLLVLLLWPRSYFFSDKWWVKNTKPIPPSKMPFHTGWDPERWSAGCAWLSAGGCLRVAHYDHLFARGELKSEANPRPWPTAKLFPTFDGLFGFVMPYWCIALVAGICPVVWMRQSFACSEMPTATRFGVRHLLYMITLTALGLTGFVQLGAGGALIALEFAATMTVGLMFTKMWWRFESSSIYFSVAISVCSFCCSIGLLFFYVDCYKKYILID